VPATSATVERVFSVRGAILRPSRRGLSDDIFEKLITFIFSLMFRNFSPNGNGNGKISAINSLLMVHYHYFLKKFVN
jgi:hypothetical protein